MSFRKIRGLFVLFLFVGFAVGFGVGLLDFPERTMLRVGLALMAVAGVVGYWYRRRLQSTGELDERHQRIERRSTRAAYGVVVLGGSVLAFVVTLGSYDRYLTGALWALVFGGVVATEGFKEYYRRRM